MNGFKTLTIELLDSFQCNEVFARGTFIDLSITNKSSIWIAIKGCHLDYSDWCIFSESPYNMGTIYGYKHFLSKQPINDYGEKFGNEKFIRKLVPCDDDVFKRYRY